MERIEDERIAFMKPFRWIFITALFFTVATMAHALDLTVQTGLSTNWWDSDTDDQGSQTYVPVTIDGVQGDFSLRVLTAFVGTRVDPSEDSKESLSTVVDTKLNLSYAIVEKLPVDILLGLKDGPVGRAIERSTAGWGEERGLCIVSERPRTLLVPTVTIRTAKQRRLFYEHAAEGVRLAIRLSIEDGFLPEAILDDVVLIANVFVHPAASIAKRVEFNNYKATRYAIRKALEGRPTVEELINEKAAARHPFRYAP